MEPLGKLLQQNQVCSIGVCGFVCSSRLALPSIGSGLSLENHSLLDRSLEVRSPIPIFADQCGNSCTIHWNLYHLKEGEAGNDFADVLSQRLSCKTLPGVHPKEVAMTCSSAYSCDCTSVDRRSDWASFSFGCFCFGYGGFNFGSRYFDHRQ